MDSGKPVEQGADGRSPPPPGPSTATVDGLAFTGATALTAMAGFNDAVGYSALAHLYVSFMSGNSTHFGISLAGADWAGAALAGAVIVTFVVGASVGTLLGDRYPESKTQRILAIELAIILAAAIGASLGAGPMALVPVAAAMGMQNVLHQRIGGADVGKGFITGNLFGLGQALARWVAGRGEGRTAFQHGWSWCSFATGVFAGAVAYRDLGVPMALAISAAVLAAALCRTAMRRSTGYQVDHPQ